MSPQPLGIPRNVFVFLSTHLEFQVIFPSIFGILHHRISILLFTFSMKTKWICSKFYHHSPGIFHFFALTPLELLVFPQIPTTFTLPHLEISIDILNRGVSNFFWKSPNQNPQHEGFHILWKTLLIQIFKPRKFSTQSNSLKFL